jgi:hypothetical protein
MAEADWTTITNALTSPNVREGVTMAFQLAHADAGAYCYAIHSINAVTGFAGKRCEIADFNPVAALKGGSISAAFKKYSSNAAYAPMIGLINGVDALSAEGYFLGLTSGSSYHIGLKKGSMNAQMSGSGSDILSLSDAAYTAVGNSQTGWFHLRLDVLVNPHGEVILNVYENDYLINGVTGAAGNWAAIPGMSQVIDDPTGIMTGKAPYTSGLFFVFGTFIENAGGSVALFDHIEISRQTSP